MNFNSTSDLVKNLDFDKEARQKVIAGANKLGRAVSGTIGASGLCVVYEDATGYPNITKDGVTVADSVVLKDAVENIGATLIKQAAKNTVKEAGDGTSSSVVLATSMLNIIEANRDKGLREIKEGLESGLEKINDYLDSVTVEVDDNMLVDVASISCNNDRVLGKIIGEAFSKVGRDGVVMIEDSATNQTYSEIIDGVQVDSKLKSPYFITNTSKETAELENPYILITESPIANIRKIKIVLEEIQRTGRPLLIIGEVEDQALKVLMTNKLNGNIKVNVIDAPSLRVTKREILDDLAIITGAKVMNESLGDDMDMITIDCLGEVDKSVTDDKKTILVTENSGEKLKERIDFVKGEIKKEENPYRKKRLEKRLATLAGKIGVVYVGADSEVELKEKKDRVDDAVHATKAAYQGGIVSGGGVALKDARNVLDDSNLGEAILKDAIIQPMRTILSNAGYLDVDHINSEVMCENTPFERFMFKLGIKKHLDFTFEDGWGINAINGEYVNMIDENIIDPVIVTKSALKNAVSVVSTITSANCVISNIRLEGGEE